MLRISMDFPYLKSILQTLKFQAQTYCTSAAEGESVILDEVLPRAFCVLSKNISWLVHVRPRNIISSLPSRKSHFVFVLTWNCGRVSRFRFIPELSQAP